MKSWRVILILFLGLYVRAENFSDEAYVEYLKENSRPPAEYVIEKLKTHDIVMLGEDHWIAPHPQFINELMKKISQDPAVPLDFFALEFSSTAQQHLADEFIDSPYCREELVLQILRDGPDFMGWGYQEVLEIFKTIWEGNRKHRDRKPVRILLLSLPHRLIEGANGLKTCNLSFQELWDKNWAIFQDRDRFMAYQLEKNVIWKDLKGIVYCGSYHNTLAPIDSSYAEFLDKAGRHVYPPGFPAGSFMKILYPDRVFSIKLHGASTGTQYYPSPDPKDWDRVWNGRLDRIFEKTGNQPAGFDLAAPIFAINAMDFFGYWKNQEAAFILPYVARLTIDKMFDGYIFLKPLREYKGATIIPGYFDDRFFREVQERVKGQAEFPTKKDLYEFICKLRPVLRSPQNLANIVMKKPAS